MTTTTPTPIETLRARLPSLNWVDTPLHIKRLSRDFHWFSPVLKRELEGKAAQAVVRPKTEVEIKALVAACAQLKVPVTCRGGGTGNYGQSVPLQGGLILDLTDFNEIVWTRNGVVRAQTGIKLAELEEQVPGWELRCMPSTYRIATLGGLFAGGFGGVGSINYGPLAAAGNVLAIKVLTVEADPRVLDIRAPEALDLAHAYGTNGIVLEIELALAPAQDWDEYLLAFPDGPTVFAAAQDIARSPGIVKRNVAMFANTVQQLLGKNIADHLRPGDHAAIVVVAPASREALLEVVRQHGGRLAWESPQDGTLIEYCWNHTTLHALKADRNLTYLQTAYTHGREREQLDAVRKVACKDVLDHLEFIRNTEGHVVCVGLPLIRYTTDDRLQELIEIHRAQGITVNDPHVYTLEDGKHGGALNPAILAAKRRFDPDNLLNPGKVRSLS